MRGSGLIVCVVEFHFKILCYAQWLVSAIDTVGPVVFIKAIANGHIINFCKKKYRWLHFERFFIASY